MTPITSDPGRITRRRFQRRAVQATAAASAVDPRTRPRRIVLTGGPGSGKSTAASFLAREFTGDLWVLPESATLLYKGGMPRGSSELGRQIAQRAIFGTQRALEAAHGEQHQERVQICDRSTIDGAAYWPGETDSFFRAMGSTLVDELARYDNVIFMHTAALLPAGYERDLEVRTEDRSLAIELDQRVFELYRSHPNLHVIRSRGSFLDKLVQVRETVAGILEGGAAQQASRSSAEVPLSALAGLGGVSASLHPASRVR